MFGKLGRLALALFTAALLVFSQVSVEAKPEEPAPRDISELAAHPDVHLGEDVVVQGWADYQYEEIRSACMYVYNYNPVIWNCDVTWYELFPIGTQSKDGADSILLASTRNDLVYERDYVIHGQWSLENGNWYLDAARVPDGTQHQ